MPTPLPIDPFVAHILKTLRHEGHQAFVVGGAVRDALLGRPVADWDVTTSAEPVAIERIFGRVKSFRLKEGTVTLLYSGAHFEVTTFRGKGRFIEDDLSHRDFTIDAIAYDPVSCEVLDPHGGKADLARRLIKGVVDPVSRFKEDPLRLLRAVRLACELGFTIERETFSAASSCAHLIRSVSPERIRDEVLKTLLSPRPMKGFNLLRRLNLLRLVLPEIWEGYRMRQEEWHQYTLFKHALLTIKAVQPTPVLRLAALFHDVAKPRVRKKSGGRLRFPDHEEASARLAEEIMKRLRFSRRLTTQVTALVRNHRIENQGRLSDGDIRRILRRIGRENCDALLALHRANILARGLHNVHPNHLDELETRFRSISEEPFAVTSADLDVNGREAMEILGIQPGPELGRVLADLLEIVTDDPSMNTRERLTSVLVKRKGSGVG